MTESEAIEAIQFDLKIGGEIHSKVLRDAVDVAIQALEKQIAGMAFANNYPANKALALCKLIDSQPTAYDVDKVLEQLEELTMEECTLHECGIRSEYCKSCIAKKAIELVKAGGVNAKADF